MSETVADPVEDESLEEIEATPPAEDVATIKRRLAGKDQALTKTQRERDEFRSEADRLRAKVAEYEQANLTEVERLQRERDEARAMAASAQAEARKQALARKNPLYADFLEATADLDPQSDEAAEAFAEFIAKFKASAASEGEETEREPRVDPNRARKSQTTAAPKKLTSAEIKAQLAEFGDDVLFGR